MFSVRSACHTLKPVFWHSNTMDADCGREQELQEHAIENPLVVYQFKHQKPQIYDKGLPPSAFVLQPSSENFKDEDNDKTFSFTTDMNAFTISQQPCKF